MDQRIFQIGLSVEATSLYLLMDSLGDGGLVLNRDTVARFWNAEPRQLDLAARELRARGIMDHDSQFNWFLRPQADWRSMD